MQWFTTLIAKEKIHGNGFSHSELRFWQIQGNGVLAEIRPFFEVAFGFWIGTKFVKHDPLKIGLGKVASLAKTHRF